MLYVYHSGLFAFVPNDSLIELTFTVTTDQSQCKRDARHATHVVLRRTVCKGYRQKRLTESIAIVGGGEFSMTQ